MSKSKLLFISHHQFLTRPNIIFPPSQIKRRPLREELLIQHPNVRDLSFDLLWKHIRQSLDTRSHDVAKCTCCCGKGPSFDDAERNFVLVLCGDLREQSGQFRRRRHVHSNRDERVRGSRPPLYGALGGSPKDLRRRERRFRGISS